MAAPKAIDLFGELLRAVGLGEISANEAIKRAAKPEIYKSLTDDVALTISRSAKSLSREDNTNESWRAGVVLHALLNASLDALDKGKELAGSRFEIAWNWIGTVSMALWHVPDPELYKDALARGQRAVASLELANEAQQVAHFMHELGMMHLDPFVALRAPTAINWQIVNWRARASAGKTWNGVKYYNLEDDGFPSVEDALANARTYFTAAVELRTGRERGWSLKGLAQALHANAIFDLEVDRPAIVAAAREALTLLDPKQDSAMIAEVSAYLNFARDDAPALPASQEWFDQSLDALVVRHGEERTRVGVMHTASNLLEREPARAFKLLLDAQPLFANNTTWELRFQVHSLTLAAFTRTFGFQIADFDATDRSSIELLAGGFRDRATAEEWDPARLAAALIALARYSPTCDQEEVGLNLIDAARSIAPISTVPLRTALGDLRALLLVNEGTNAVNQADWNRAVIFYGMALAWAVEVASADLLSNLLGRLADVVKRGGISTTDVIVETLLGRTDMIEIVGRQDASARLQEIYRLASTAIIENNGSLSALWTLIQLAKGRRFAAMLAAGCTHTLSPDDVDPLFLEQIAKARTEAGPDGSTVGEPFADEVLVSPYSQESLRLDGDTAPERLLNLEHRYDVALHDRLVMSSADSSGLLATESSVRDVLDDDTVLLQYYFTSAGDGSSLLIAAVTTRDATEWRAVKIESDADAKLVVDGFEVIFTYASTVVESLRRAVNEEPGDAPVSEHAQETIAHATRLLVDPVAALLASHLSNGKSHLCIVPHGPLAFAPVHLLGSFPKTLSNDWTVTYLPNLQLLSMRQGGPALGRHRSRKLASFGLSFAGDVREYQEIPEAVVEAKAVARAFDTVAILDDEATEGALREAFRDARFVHIATHGAQREMAPCFQTLCLATDGDDDGEFYAHELLGMDLRELELVTLSACETALGRFDAADNPHGLPATLLLAGAHTIIGTLWEIETNCSALFFTTLYGELAKTDSKLGAFHKALRVTREQFPQLRDWGGFYFTGGWR